MVIVEGEGVKKKNIIINARIDLEGNVYLQTLFMDRAYGLDQHGYSFAMKEREMLILRQSVSWSNSSK